MKLSVIVPVYNTEKYLQQSIESIIGQTYKDIEVILVDDGSTDNSGKICNQYAAAYDNFKVIHQENGGNFAARCRGAKEATGDYLTFMDSDDWIEEDMYEELMRVAVSKKSDIVTMGGYTFYDNGECYPIEDTTMYGTYTQGIDMDVFYSKMMYDEERETRGILPSLCCKVIKKNIILQTLTAVDCNITMGGDAAIFYPCCLKAERICIIEGYKLFYRMRNKSVSHSYDIKAFDKINNLYNYLKKDFSEFNNQYNLVGQLRKYLWHLLSVQIEQIFSLKLKRTYIFPYKLVDKNSKIILYGAGKVGQSYYEQIKKNGYCDIVAWVDRNACKENKNIISLTEIIGLEYSQIVIGIKSKEIADEIINDLIMSNVDKEKIVWEQPYVMSLL